MKPAWTGACPHTNTSRTPCTAHQKPTPTTAPTRTGSPGPTVVCTAAFPARRQSRLAPCAMCSKPGRTNRSLACACACDMQCSAVHCAHAADGLLLPLSLCANVRTLCQGFVSCKLTAAGDYCTTSNSMAPAHLERAGHPAICRACIQNCTYVRCAVPWFHMPQGLWASCVCKCVANRSPTWCGTVPSWLGMHLVLHSQPSLFVTTWGAHVDFLIGRLLD